MQDYGHRVRLATHSNFKEFVLTAGLEFYPLGGDPKVLAGCMYLTHSLMIFWCNLVGILIRLFWACSYMPFKLVSWGAFNIYFNGRLLWWIFAELNLLFFFCKFVHNTASLKYVGVKLKIIYYDSNWREFNLISCLKFGFP